MLIDLHRELEYKRNDKIVIGKPSSFDISEIFKKPTCDFIDNKLITKKIFDNESIFYIQRCGYTKCSSLIEAGFKNLKCDSLDSELFVDNLK